MRNAEVAFSFRPKPEAINRPMARRLQAYEESSEKVMDVVRRETLDTVENLSPLSRTELGQAVLSNMRDSLVLLQASGVWQGSVEELAGFLQEKPSGKVG